MYLDMMNMRPVRWSSRHGSFFEKPAQFPRRIETTTAAVLRRMTGRYDHLIQFIMATLQLLDDQHDSSGLLSRFMYALLRQILAGGVLVFFVDW